MSIGIVDNTVHVGTVQQNTNAAANDWWTHKCLPCECSWTLLMKSICNWVLTLGLSSSRIQMDALVHRLTPFCSVCRQFFGFIPGDAHVLQISSDNVLPFFRWPSQLPLVAPQFPLYSLMRYLESSILNTCPSHLSLLSLMMSSNFRNQFSSWSLRFLLRGDWKVCSVCIAEYKHIGNKIYTTWSVECTWFSVWWSAEPRHPRWSCIPDRNKTTRAWYLCLPTCCGDY